MKKLFLALAFAGSVTMTQAQISKGTIQAGGNLGFSTSSNDISGSEWKRTTTNFGPQVGYFFADDMEAVLALSMTSANTEQDANNGFKTSTFSWNIGVNKYFMKSDQFGFWAGLGLTNGKTTNENKVANVITETENKNMNVGLAAGITYFPVPKIGLSAGVGVLGMNVAENANGDKTTTIGLNIANGVTNGLNFGFHWYFGND